MKYMTFKAGTRGSELAMLQTRGALDRLTELFPWLSFERVTVATPGDRDLTSDLRGSPADFFTRDLDDALRDGRIDLAVHSAKDLPSPMPEGIDWRCARKRLWRESGCSYLRAEAWPSWEPGPGVGAF